MRERGGSMGDRGGSMGDRRGTMRNRGGSMRDKGGTMRSVTSTSVMYVCVHSTGNTPQLALQTEVSYWVYCIHLTKNLHPQTHSLCQRSFHVLTLATELQCLQPTFPVTMETKEVGQTEELWRNQRQHNVHHPIAEVHGRS